MRPYLVFCAVVLIAVSASGQDLRSWHRRQPHPNPGYPGTGYSYGETYAPVITTPMLSLETFSPNPVGASNATTGLAVGATNATISDLPEGSTSSDYTVAVWYQGGSPVITPQVNTWPIPREPGPTMGYGRGDEPEMMEHHRPQARAAWTYFSGPEYTADVTGTAKTGPSKHSYTNDDVTRQNNNNGNVHYDGKTEKIQ